MKVTITFRWSLLMLLIGFMLFPPALAQAQSTVTGTVLDDLGEPIIGATVLEKGTTNGVVTDIDGNFSLKMQNAKNKLVFSFVGMTSQELDATPGKPMSVTLAEDNQVLEDVVVIGYGSKARKDLTGSVGSISGAKLEVVPVASAAEALAGKIAGVQVTSVDGQPGADINIRVRGATSVTQSDDPLFIVDGFQVDNINDIPPSDIQSIDVLKDASLTAIYGAKGGNGVVVVTTKSAQEGKIQVSFNGRLTMATLAKKLDLMGTQDFVDYQYDRAAANGTRSSWAKSFRNNFGHPTDIDIYARASSHDWQDEVMGENPINYQGNVTVGGGNEKTKFNLSISQSEDRGIIMGSGVRRTVMNLKLDTKIANNLKFTYNPKMTYRRDEGAGGDNIGSGGIIDVLRYRPTNGLREFAHWDAATVDADEEANFEYTNPKNDIQTNVQKKHQYTIVNQASLTWNPIKNLTLRSEGNFSIGFRDTDRYYGPLTSTAQSSIHNSLPLATTTERTTQSYTWTNTASYNLDIEDHNLSFLLGQELYNSQYKEKSQTNHLFQRSIDAETAFNNMALGTPYESSSKLSTANRMASFFGQVSYNYQHRYLLSVTFRADGSSKFAPGNQWGYFPSVSGAWVINKEKFLENVNWIDQLKLRAAVGLAGNNNISDDLWRFLYSSESSGGPAFGEASQYGELYYSVPSSYPNQNIKWETTLTRNFALDVNLFKGRLTITPEVYFNTTSDLLYSSTIPTVTGYGKQMQNIGKVTNNGWELTINGDILRGKNYVLSANFTLGMNKMTVKKLNDTDGVLYNYSSRWKTSGQQDYILRVGDEVGLFYGYIYDGLFSPDEFTYDVTQNYLPIPKETTITGMDDILTSSNSGVATLPGKIKFKDLNGDGVIDENDKTVIGNTNPKVQGGFGINGTYKAWDFSMNFTYMLDFDVYNGTAYQLSSSSTSQYNFYNVLSKFNRDSRWTYTRQSDGECMYKNYYEDGALDYYLYELNANKSLWNPADLVNNVMFDYFVEDGSFLRCTDLTIGWTMPNKWSKKAGMSKLRIYASTSNLFIITNYSGYDPEVDVQSGLTPSMDYNRYPRNRAFSVGVNVTF